MRKSIFITKFHHATQPLIWILQIKLGMFPQTKYVFNMCVFAQWTWIYVRARIRLIQFACRRCFAIKLIKIFRNNSSWGHMTLTMSGSWIIENLTSAKAGRSTVGWCARIDSLEIQGTIRLPPVTFSIAITEIYSACNFSRAVPRCPVRNPAYRQQGIDKIADIFFAHLRLGHLSALPVPVTLSQCSWYSMLVAVPFHGTKFTFLM